MHKISVSFIAALMAMNPCAAENPDDYSLAEKMSYLSDLGWFGNIEQAARRYEYLLPRFRDLCSDALTETKAGDMLYASYLKVKEAGASGEENLLRYADNAYRVVTAVSRKYKLAGVPLRCAKVFASYAHSRREGNSGGKICRCGFGRNQRDCVSGGEKDGKPQSPGQALEIQYQGRAGKTGRRSVLRGFRAKDQCRRSRVPANDGSSWNLRRRIRCGECPEQQDSSVQAGNENGALRQDAGCMQELHRPPSRSPQGLHGG